MQDERALKLGILESLALKLASAGLGCPCPHTSAPLSPVTHHSLQPSCRWSPGARVTLAPSPEVCQQLHCSGRIQPPACSSRPCAQGKIRAIWDRKVVTYVSCTMLASCSTHVCGDKVGRRSQHRSDVLPTGGDGVGRAPPFLSVSPSSGTHLGAVAARLARWQVLTEPMTQMCGTEPSTGGATRLELKGR